MPDTADRVLRELHARGEPDEPERPDPDGAEPGEATAEEVSQRDAGNHGCDRQEGHGGLGHREQRERQAERSAGGQSDEAPMAAWYRCDGGGRAC